MPLSTYLLVLLIIEIILYTFHLSVLILMIAKRRTVFQGPFYKIFRMVLFADLMAFITINITQKLRLIQVFLDFFVDNMYIITGGLVINNYVTTMQYVGHLLLAFNRFTIICFPTIYNKIWERQWYIFLLIVIPFLPICWRLHQPIIFTFAADGSVTAAVFVNAEVAKMSNILSSIVYFTTTFLAAVLNVLAFIKLVLHKNNHPSTFNVKERNLLYVSFIIFLSQLLRITYNVNGIFFASNFEMVAFFNTILPVLMDIFAWSGTISLMILSKSTRKTYINFYLCGSQTLVSDISKSKSTPPRLFSKVVSTY